MLKISRNFLMAGFASLALAACGDDLTITEPPVTPPPPAVPAITTFSVSPGSATIAPGGFLAASATLITKPGTSGSVAWTSSNPAVASISNESNSGVTITAVATGSAVITAVATADGETASAAIGVTVRPLVPAQISIQSITTANLGTPVNVGNVKGQIEVNMNFDPGEERVDSVAFYIGGTQAASQTYVNGPAPAAGLISLSTNTAHYTKNVAAGTTTVRYPNGATTISAAVYRAGQPPIATNQVAIVLNNADGWAADLDLPTRVADNGAGVSYWGGPGADGVAEATVYPVIYTPNRSVESVTFRVGVVGFIGCTSNITMTTMPFRATFGYGDVADVDCGPSGDDYEWTGGFFSPRDNVIVVAALDNASTPFAAPAPLIANTVVLGSTPDSARFDWDAPSVSTPSVTRTAPAVDGWVNASFAFVSTQSDNGVGVASSTGTSIFYNAPNCTGGGSANPVPSKTGADIPECSTNSIGGLPGLGGTAPYRAYGTGADRLGNAASSGQSQNFGVDKTTPTIRWGTVEAGTYTNASVSADTVFRASKPSSIPSEFRVEYLDLNTTTNVTSGFYNMGIPSGGIAAQQHALSMAGHLNNAGTCIIGSGPIGAAFVTAPACGMAYITVAGALRLDGWQGGETVLVPEDESYYGYATRVTDAAGNVSTTMFRKVLVNSESPFASLIGIPGALTATSFNFTPTFADSAEIVAQSLQLEYPNFAGLTGSGESDSVRYTRTAIGTAFDDVITSPYTGTIAPPNGPPYLRHIEAVTATAFPNNNVNATPANVQPTTVRAWSWNHGSTLSGGPLPGVTNDGIAPSAIPGLFVEPGVPFVSFNAGNVTNSVTHFRVIPTVATSNQFGSTTPLRAQAASPTNTPNPPFARVDFYRWDGVSHWNYLGSDATAIPSDQGTYRSWVWDLPNASFVAAWNGAAQGSLAATNVIAAVGVTSAGDGLLAGAIMTP